MQSNAHWIIDAWSCLAGIARGSSWVLIIIVYVAGLVGTVFDTSGNIQWNFFLCLSFSFAAQRICVLIMALSSRVLESTDK
jgi:hypothetical protein